nr:NADH-quinone oxidoreductase subunit D [Deltaproteobacteria bacterium]
WAQSVKSALAVIESRIPEYESITLSNGIFFERTKGIGILDGELALELGITGPILRASGVDHDLRRDAPYHAYDELEVKVASAEGGDCWARSVVRLAELRESLRIVRTLVDAVPEGPICGYKPIKLVGQVKIPSGQVYSSMESSRGELGTYVIAGGGEGNVSPYRLKIRPPSFHALSALPYLLPGHMIADAVVILGSLDPIMGEVDR